MVYLLLQLTAFASAALLVSALGRWWLLLRARYAEPFDEGEGRFEGFVSLAARELPGEGLQQLRRQIRLDLGRAGEAPDAERFLARSLLEGVALAVGLTALFTFTGGGPTILLGAGLGAFHAFAIRPQMLRTRAAERTGRISRRLPYAIDLAALVLGAGGTPREALELMARPENDPLAEELARALVEMKSGAPQHKALTDLAERLELEDLSILVTAINRGEATGAPMARALETQAEVFRFRRLQRAERLAVEAPVKMMFPNMLIMMSVLLLVLGPVLVKLIQGGLL